MDPPKVDIKEASLKASAHDPTDNDAPDPAIRLMEIRGKDQPLTPDELKYLTRTAQMRFWKYVIGAIIVQAPLLVFVIMDKIP